MRRLDKIRNEEIRSLMQNNLGTIDIRQAIQVARALTAHGQCAHSQTVLQGKVQGTIRKGKPRKKMGERESTEIWNELASSSERAQNRGEWKKYDRIVGAHVKSLRLKQK